MSVEKTTVRVGGIASKAWGIYRSNANTMLLLAAIMIVPAYIVLALLIGLAAPEGFFDLTEQEIRSETVGVDWDGGDVAALVTAGLIGATVALIATMLATGSCFKVIQEVYSDRTPDWRASLAAARARLGALVWLGIISGLLLALAFLALIVPAIYLYVAWSVAVPVLMTEDLRGTKALGRSRALVKGTWWPVFGVMVIGIAASLAVGLVLGMIFQAGADNPSLGEGLTLGTLQEVVTQIIVLPFVAALAGVLYFELRRVKEDVVEPPPVAPAPPAAPPPPTV